MTDDLVTMKLSSAASVHDAVVDTSAGAGGVAPLPQQQLSALAISLGLHDGMAPVAFLDAILCGTGHSSERWRAERVPACSLDPNKMAEMGNYGALVTALRRGRLKEFHQLLAAEGSSCSAANSCGHTLLHCAARMGNVEVARTLIEGGADPSLADESGKTALHDACWAVEFSCAMLLLLGGRNPRLFCAIDRFGATPLDYCHPGMHMDSCRFVAAVQSRWWPKSSSS